MIKYEHEQSPTVTGRILSLGGKPVPKGRITLMASSNGQPFIKDTIADNNGHFIFKDLYFADTTRVAVRAGNAKDEESVRLILDKKPKTLYHNMGDGVDEITDQSLNEYLTATRGQFTELNKFGLFKNAITLKEVSVKAKKSDNADKVIPHSVN